MDFFETLNGNESYENFFGKVLFLEAIFSKKSKGNLISPTKWV